MGQGAHACVAPLCGGKGKTMTIVEKLWGREKIFFNDPNKGYCLKELTVDSNGNACSIHFHKAKTETFYVTHGRIFLERYRTLLARPGIDVTSIAHLEDRSIRTLHIGDHITLVPYTPHRFWAVDGPGVFIEGSSYDSPFDSFRVVRAGPIPTDFDPSLVRQYKSL